MICCHADKPVVQSFFQQHDDDICSLAVHPNGFYVASGQSGSNPSIYIWDTTNVQNIIKHIAMPRRARGVCALGFTPGIGRLLTAVSMDDYHTVSVFDWKLGLKLCEGVGYKGIPHQVSAVTHQMCSDLSVKSM